MFNNLIESSSHAHEFKRRGSFFLFTIVAYGLLFVGGGVASIYAYEAHLDEQDTAVVVTMVPPSQPEVKKPIQETHPVRSTRESSAHPGFDERRNPTATTSQPLVPTKVSAERNPELPVRDVPWQVSNRDADAGALPGGGSDRSTSGTNNTARIAVEMEKPPPPPPIKKQVPETIKISEVLNGRAMNLPKPVYPKLAIEIRLSGQVSVQVLIDETGRVVSAHAVSGHPVLAPSAVRAANQARFSPTIVGGTPVKVSGIITYNFVLQ